MRLFKAKFNGIWLAGYAIILADNADHAADLLVSKLTDDDLLKNGENIRHKLIDQIEPISMEKPHAEIIWNGDY